MSDLNTLYRNTEPWIAAAAHPNTVIRVGDRDLLDQLSPLPSVDAMTAPLLLVHGGNDTNVPASESQQMYEALRALGRSVELLVFDDDGHEIDKRENRAVLVRVMNDWLITAFAADTHFVTELRLRHVWRNCLPGKHAACAPIRGATTKWRRSVRRNSRRRRARVAADRRGRRLSARLLQERRSQLRHSGDHRPDGGRRPAELRGGQPEGDELQLCPSPASSQLAVNNSEEME